MSRSMSGDTLSPDRMQLAVTMAHMIWTNRAECLEMEDCCSVSPQMEPTLQCHITETKETAVKLIPDLLLCCLGNV